LKFLNPKNSCKIVVLKEQIVKRSERLKQHFDSKELKKSLRLSWFLSHFRLGEGATGTTGGAFILKLMPEMA